jgi:transcriptional regulator with XRE-family HTH domain
MTTQELAKRLGVSRVTFWNWRRSGMPLVLGAAKEWAAELQRRKEKTQAVKRLADCLGVVEGTARIFIKQGCPLLDHGAAIKWYAERRKKASEINRAAAVKRKAERPPAIGAYEAAAAAGGITKIQFQTYRVTYKAPLHPACFCVWFLWFKAERERLRLMRKEEKRRRANERHHLRMETDPEYAKKVIERNRRNCNKPEIKVKRIAYGYEYRKRPGWKERVREQMKQRIKNDPQFRLRKILRGRIWAALDRYSGEASKCNKSMNLLGCSIPEWRGFLESKFRRGMTWENYGTEWHIDHVLPIAKFDLTNPIQQKLAFHYSNTQPLWKTENLSKGDRITNPQLPLLV